MRKYQRKAAALLAAFCATGALLLFVGVSQISTEAIDTTGAEALPTQVDELPEAPVAELPQEVVIAQANLQELQEIVSSFSQAYFYRSSEQTGEERKEIIAPFVRNDLLNVLDFRDALDDPSLAVADGMVVQVTAPPESVEVLAEDGKRFVATALVTTEMVLEGEVSPGGTFSHTTVWEETPNGGWLLVQVEV